MTVDQYCMHAIVSGRGHQEEGLGSANRSRSKGGRGGKGGPGFISATYVGLVELL